MASLAAQDSYLQGLARKVCVQHAPESRKRKFVSKPGQAEDAGRQLKKKKRKKPSKQAEKTSPSVKQVVSNTNKPTPGQKAAPQASKSSPQGDTQSRNETLVTGSKSELGSPSFSAMNLLRQRLHEKIKKASGQVDAKELPPAVLEKRQRRKYERERKKRRRKELKMKAKMEKKETEEVPVEPESKKEESAAETVFNRVEVHEENELSKTQKKKEKRKAVKGSITPLTGKNYKQLLSRLETRKNKLEELKDKDQKKAQELENKMKWTNALYKAEGAEGVKIRDDEERLKEALKRKEKRKAQRQRQWEKRTEKVVEKMQQRQEKRRKNIQKKKKDRIEKKKARARKKGRVLPEDLKKAGL
ncbi:SURF6 protein, partial [Pelecanoides urinatrix]|nr:SURF6 protein [Pelecanoides urinatrix]